MKQRSQNSLEQTTFLMFMKTRCSRPQTGHHQMCAVFKLFRVTNAAIHDTHLQSSKRHMFLQTSVILSILERNMENSGSMDMGFTKLPTTFGSRSGCVAVHCTIFMKSMDVADSRAQGETYADALKYKKRNLNNIQI